MISSWQHHGRRQPILREAVSDPAKYCQRWNADQREIYPPWDGIRDLIASQIVCLRPSNLIFPTTAGEGHPAVSRLSIYRYPMRPPARFVSEIFRLKFEKELCGLYQTSRCGNRSPKQAQVEPVAGPAHARSQPDSKYVIQWYRCPVPVVALSLDSTAVQRVEKRRHERLKSDQHTQTGQPSIVRAPPILRTTAAPIPRPATSCSAQCGCAASPARRTSDQRVDRPRS
jgi:hypothetical protein